MGRKIELQQEEKSCADFLQCESGYSGQIVSCGGTVEDSYQREP